MAGPGRHAGQRFPGAGAAMPPSEVFRIVVGRVAHQGQGAVYGRPSLSEVTGLPERIGELDELTRDFELEDGVLRPPAGLELPGLDLLAACGDSFGESRLSGGQVDRPDERFNPRESRATGWATANPT